ncbi:hypothetical protein [Streptomyces sp. NPDC055107]
MGNWNTSQIEFTPHGTAYRDMLHGDNEQKRIDGFVSLLQSEETPFTAIALDHYAECAALERLGFENLFEACDTAVLSQCRRLLHQPPTARSQEPLALEESANHASAAAAILNLAQPEDAEIIGEMIRTSSSRQIRLDAILAASSIFMDDPSGNDSLKDILGAVALDDSSLYQERSAALYSLQELMPEKSTRLIMRAAAVNDIRIQAQALLILAEEDFSQYRELIERVAASWPAQVSYPATDVLALLHNSRT